MSSKRQELSFSRCKARLVRLVDWLMSWTRWAPDVDAPGTRAGALEVPVEGGAADRGRAEQPMAGRAAHHRLAEGSRPADRGSILRPVALSPCRPVALSVEVSLSATRTNQASAQEQGTA